MREKLYNISELKGDSLEQAKANMLDEYAINYDELSPDDDLWEQDVINYDEYDLNEWDKWADLNDVMFDSVGEMYFIFDDELVLYDVVDDKMIFYVKGE